MPGAALLELADLEHLTLTVYVPEDRYGQVALGEQVTVTVDSFPGQAFRGTVSRIADQAEFTPRNVQTVEGRTTTVFAVDLALDPSDGRLKPGMPADVASHERAAHERMAPSRRASMPATCAARSAPSAPSTASTLAVQPGEAYGLVGPDGAGKTTTLRLLVGALRPGRGPVSVGGFDMAASPTRARAGIGYLAQRF